MKTKLFCIAMIVLTCVGIAGCYVKNSPPCIQQVKDNQVENSSLPFMGFPRIMPV